MNWINTSDLQHLDYRNALERIGFTLEPEVFGALKIIPPNDTPFTLLKTLQAQMLEAYVESLIPEMFEFLAYTTHETSFCRRAVHPRSAGVESFLLIYRSTFVCIDDPDHNIAHALIMLISRGLPDNV